MSKKYIDVKETKVLIKKVVMGNLSEVSSAFLPFVDDFETIVNRNKGLSQTDMMDLITKHSKHAVVLASVLTDQDSDFFENLEPLEFFHVMNEMVNYSGDFFLTQILIPSQKLAKRIVLLGLTANSSLKNMDTQERKY